MRRILGGVSTAYGLIDLLLKVVDGSLLERGIAALRTGTITKLAALILLTTVLVAQAMFIDEMLERLWERAEEHRFRYYAFAFLLLGYGAGIWLSIPVSGMMGDNAFACLVLVLFIFFIVSLMRNMPTRNGWEYSDKVQFGYKIVLILVLIGITVLSGSL